jgi:hypothetical protein
MGRGIAERRAGGKAGLSHSGRDGGVRDIKGLRGWVREVLRC